MDAITTGLDMAAEAKRTAMVRIVWGNEGAEVTKVEIGVPDHLALHYLHEPGAKVGIDAPLGWPHDFIEFITAHSFEALRQAPLDLGSPMDSEGHPELRPAWRRPLANRMTDLYVRHLTPLVPLSVSTDRIAHVAMRTARLTAHCSRDMNRDGSGDIAEVYPSASLFVWGQPYRGYKGTERRSVRDEMLKGMLCEMPHLRVNADQRRRLVDSDDALDAFVCALTARAVQLGHTHWPPDDLHADRARVEGWIHAPTIELSQIVR